MNWSEWHALNLETMRRSSPHGWEERFSREVLQLVDGLDPSKVFVQVPFGDPRGRRRFMDFAIVEPPKVRLAIEVDDQSTHDPARVSQPKFNDDLARQNELIKEGYTVLRFSVPQVRDAPMACVDDIKQTLDRLRRVGDAPRPQPVAFVASAPLSPSRLPLYLGIAGLIGVGVLAFRSFGVADTPPPTAYPYFIPGTAAPATTPPRPTSAVTPGPNGECHPPAEIKGNVTTRSDGTIEKIYHVPGGDFYLLTKAEACFVSEVDAVAAGFRKSVR